MQIGRQLLAVRFHSFKWGSIVIKERTTVDNSTSGMPEEPPGEPASKTGWVLPYGTAVLSVAVAILLSDWVVPDGQYAFPIFYGAVMVSGWYGGLGPGLLATALSALAGVFLFLPVQYSLALAFNEAVHTTVFMVVALLITLLNEARRRAEKVLAGQRRQLHTAISSISDAVIATDTRGRVTFMNPMAEELTGWQATEARGRPLEAVFRIINEPNGALISNPLSQVKRSGFALGLASQSLLLAKDGRETPIDYSAATVKDSGGRTAGVVLVFDNISERKQAEQATRQAAERAAQLYEAERAARTEAEQAQHRFYAAATDNARLYLEAQEEIAARKRVEEQLTRSLQEKEVLLREVHHRVKNNLQAISNLLYLQANTVDDRQIREKLSEARNRVKSIALIHEKLYQTRDLDHLDFGEYLRSLVDHLIHSFVRDPEMVNLNLHIGPEKVNLDTAVPLGIIVNELVSNSLKYAFPNVNGRTDDRANEIRIELESGDEDQLLLIVGDNGVGLPEEIDPDSAPTLGLQLVRMLANHMGGELELNRRNGTEYRIRLSPVKMDRNFTP